MHLFSHSLVVACSRLAICGACGGAENWPDGHGSLVQLRKPVEVWASSAGDRPARPDSMMESRS